MNAVRPVIALIDDDAWLVDEYTRTLNKAGYRTVSASNALEGIDLIDTAHPQAIILDIFMPGPNGIVLIHELRSHTDLAQIPIIVATNSASDIDESAMAAYGVLVVLDKTTMKPDDLIVAVRKVLP